MDALSRASLLALTAAALAALLCGCEDGGGGGPSLPVVTITATDASAAEEGSDPGTFTLTRTGETIDDLVVYFSIATGAGEATNDVDYQEQASAGPLPASATIPAGETTVAITIVPVDDAEIEGPETVTLTLSFASTYTVGAPADRTARVTIADHEEPPPEISIAATDAAAAEEGSDPGTFTVSRTGNTADALVVSFTIATGPGEATNGADYVEELSGTDLATSVTIPAGSASTTITVVPVDDSDIEGPETVTLTIAADAAYTVAAAPADTAAVTIAENDFPPEVSIAATDPDAAEEASDPGTFTLTRTGDTTDALVVALAIAT